VSGDKEDRSKRMTVGGFCRKVVGKLWTKTVLLRAFLENGSWETSRETQSATRNPKTQKHNKEKKRRGEGDSGGEKKLENVASPLYQLGLKGKGDQQKRGGARGRPGYCAQETFQSPGRGKLGNDDNTREKKQIQGGNQGKSDKYHPLMVGQKHGEEERREKNKFRLGACGVLGMANRGGRTGPAPPK